ncbi:CAP domain-containing protein [Alteromonas confluentis]|uniref:CAP domain-containing protein n=1 Tax=Alteromonas confluentis TaxID=1656094 RepID=UPI001B8C2427|nr:CAP domain-containing protein [Alteromonas confluentis]
MRIATLFTLIFSINVFTVGASEQPAENDVTACGFSAKAIALARLIQQDPGQQRTVIECHPLLAQAAEDKARVMAEFGAVMHNLGGSPNSRLREIGFPLPRYYSVVMGNQVEAIAGGYSTPESVWRSFKDSKPHRQHLLGELDFYREQQYMGVGFYSHRNTPHVEYWVVYVTKAADELPVPYFEYISNKGVFVVQQIKPELDLSMPK